MTPSEVFGAMLIVIILAIGFAGFVFDQRKEPINLDKPEETVKEDEHANNIGI